MIEPIKTVVAAMPCSIKAYTVCKDDYYTIVLNDAISIDEKRDAYLHEISHIKNGDFDQIADADQIEYVAHM